MLKEAKNFIKTINFINFRLKINENWEKLKNE